MGQNMTPWNVGSAISMPSMTTQKYNGGAAQAGDFMNSGNDSAQGGNIFGDMGGLSKGLDFAGKGLGIFGDIMGYMNQKKGLEAAITGMNNTTKANNYNMGNKTDFLNSASDAFGHNTASGPKQHTQNQFGSMV